MIAQGPSHTRAPVPGGAEDRPVKRAGLRPWPAAVLVVCLLAAVGAQRAHGADDDPQRYVEFVQDFTANCVARQGVQIQVRSRHASRGLRVWLDRYHMGVGTGDRSRSDLLPGAEPVALGCSRTTTGAQEWRLVRASFID